MEKKDIIGIIIGIVMILVLLYLVLGSMGLLPKYFYNLCEDITVEQAKKRGCCEDRSKHEPISIMFGEDNCDRYRENK